MVMAVALTGSFTSCVDNEIPDEVTAIYEGQGDLLAAQAALLEAQSAEASARAANLEAQAAFQQALADAEVARTEMQRIQNELMLASNEIELERLQAQLEVQRAQYAQQIASAELQAEKDRIAAEQAQLQWEQTQATLQAAIAAAAEAQVQAAYNSYLSAISTYNGLVDQEINQRLAVLNQMDVINDGMITDAATLAGLEAAVEAEQTMIADLEAQVSDLEGLLVTGTVADYNAQLAAYKERIAEIAATLNEWEIAVELADQELVAAQAEVTATGADDVMADYNALQAMHNNVLFGGGTYAGLEADRNAVTTAENLVEAQEVKIAELQEIVDNYDTKLADFEAAVAAAEAAEAAADADVAAAIAAEAAAEAAHDDAIDAVTDANSDLSDVQAMLTTANTDLDAAAVALANAIAAQTDTTPFENAVTAAEAAVVTAQTEYDNFKTIFDADPAGSTVIDGGIDGFIGNDGDASPTSYRRIDAVNAGGEATLAATTFATLPAGEAATAVAWDNFTNADVGLYYDIEADDAPAVDNVVLLQNAADALDNAKAAVVTAENNLENVIDANDISDEQADYDAAAAFFANAEAEVAAAEAAVAAAVAAEAAAEDAEDDAEDAVVAAQTAQTTAQGNTAAANAALTTFENSTETEYQDQLQGAIADLEFLADTLADAEATLAANVALSDELAAQIAAGPVFTAEQTAAVEARDEAQMAKDALLALEAPLLQEDNNLDALVTIVEGILNTSAANFDAGNNSKEAIEMAIEGLMNQIDTAQAALATAQDNVALFTDGSAAAQAELERREATLAATQALVEAWQARVDRRLAILEALL